MKFKVGDVVRQVGHGWNTNSGDEGKEAIVIEVGGKFLSGLHSRNDGIRIECFGDWHLTTTDWRGEDGFEFVRHDINRLKIEIGDTVEATRDCGNIKKGGQYVVQEENGRLIIRSLGLCSCWDSWKLIGKGRKVEKKMNINSLIDSAILKLK